MERDRYDGWLFVSLAGLGVWLTLAAGGMTWLDPDTAVLGCALLALTTATVAVTDLFPYAGWVAAGASSAFYAGLQVTLWGLTVSALVNAGVGVVGLVGTALLNSVTARQLSTLVHQLERDRRLIDELTVHDPETGLMKEQYAHQTLKSEIARSRHYRSDLSLLLMQVADWDQVIEEHGAAGADALMDEIATTIMADTLRMVDIPFTFNTRTLGVILPEISAECARMTAQRLIDGVARKVRVALHVGIAQFPDDGVTGDELLRAAEAALRFGLPSGQSIVCYTQLRSAVEAEEDIAREPHMEPGHEQTGPQQQEQGASITIHPKVLLKS